MLLLRQVKTLTRYDPRPGISIATLAHEYATGFEVEEHAHGSDQLIYAVSGVMEVHSGQSMWLIPPHFALWIPARVKHRIRMLAAVSMRTLYIRKGLVVVLPPSCAVLHVTPLLRELVLETVRTGQLHTRNRLEHALCEMVISRIEKASCVPTFVTLPGESRALAVAEAVLNNPDLRCTLATLCSRVGVSVRTIQRAFQRDVGTDFESWRRQVRLTKAVELLTAGSSVKQAAFAVGYRQSSAFVEVFRRTFGAPPKSWVTALDTPVSGVRLEGKLGCEPDIKA
jgi:AraC-like DNA-binding protein